MRAARDGESGSAFVLGARDEKERNRAVTHGDENSEGRFAELAIFQLKGPPETVETEKIAFLGAGEGHPSS